MILLRYNDFSTGGVLILKFYDYPIISKESSLPVFLVSVGLNEWQYHVKCDKGDNLDAYAFVMSSNYEGMSNSLLEALGMGIPVISTDHPIGGARMFIQDGKNGLLTKVGDSESMYQAIKKLIETPELIKKFTVNIDDFRKELSLTNIADQWIDYTRKIVAGEAK